MKPIKIQQLTIALSLLMLAGCTEQSQNTNEQGEMPPVLNQLALNSTGLEGIWINKKYADELVKTGSPKASQEAGLGSTTMLVFPREIPNMVLIIWNFHEGNNTFFKETNGGFEFEPNTGNKVTLRIDKGLLKTPTEEFIRLEELNQKRDYYVAEQLLFAGKYDLNGKPIEFTKDGRIIGLDEFTYYAVELDYIGPGMDVDQLRLGKSAEKTKNYAFTYDKNVLTIYELDCADELCIKVKNGKELYRLVKSK